MTTMEKFMGALDLLGVEVVDGPVPDTKRLMFGGRCLLARWVPEIAEDLKMFHGIDAEKELAQTVLLLVAQEINAQNTGPAPATPITFFRKESE
jgi:hypothetical protein